jgi:hypothetical protein
MGKKQSETVDPSHTSQDKKESSESSKKDKKPSKPSKELKINFGDIFIYDFKNNLKVRSILESALHKFSEGSENFDDAMGRIKYALISYLSSTKTENAKLYYSISRFLIIIIEEFDHPELIDWIHAKLIPNIESNFLYELALLDLIECGITMERNELVQTFVKEVLDNINSYPQSEIYNLMNSFNMLVKRVKKFNTPEIYIMIRDTLLEHEKDIKGIDYKIQFIELLEDLKCIEDAYELAEKTLKNLPPDSVRIADIRKIKNRLKEKPL